VTILLALWLAVGLVLAMGMAWIGFDERDPWWVVLFVVVVAGFCWPVTVPWHIWRSAMGK
jgi:hypothetical protein